ncbi:hypothetical protein GGX14DRAFT_437608 [Mycena pura]|uniref:DUF4470 domain-containing protein n=1 Tax=Mycena pura TaxID=153505 RepID=A0AAD6VT28_9AGAR|nr:hypothetical protein GGX14DRAFT_437608 [Mycena pura]
MVGSRNSARKGVAAPSQPKTQPESRALLAKEKGNKAFIQSKWLNAAQHYQEAEKLEPTNPIYPSNLSAALFEMGNYTECASAILRCCSHLDFETQAPLASRLSIRLAKALSQSFAAGNSIAIHENTPEIARVEQAGPTEGPDATVWSFWRNIALNPNHPVAVDDARARLLNLPILKQALSASCEYFSISHDDVQSLLENCSMRDGPGNAAGLDSIDLTSLPPTRLSSLAFLLGGVGDARHVFGTLVGIHETSRRMNTKQQDALKVHVTLLDIKEHALARDLVVVFLLSKIMTCIDTVEKLELQATVFYLYTALVMPRYCHRRFCDAAEEIQSKLVETGNKPLPWISLDSRCVPAIQAALRLWTSLPSISTAHHLSQHVYSPSTDENRSFNLADESKWYSEIKAFLPPVELWDRHPEFSAYRQPTAQASKANMKKAATHVKTSWVVNPTLFDDSGERRLVTMDGDTFGIIRQLATFHRRHKVTPFRLLADSPAFGYVAGFFDSVIAALESLRGKVTLEFIHGDLQSELLRMRTYPALRENLKLPVKFTKIWLSNVPDYINGPLGTALFVVPSLQDTNSKTGANHLLSFPAFYGEPKAFSNTYAHLEARDFSSHLGCRVVYMDVLDVTILSPLPLPRPNPELATREVLKTWLIRVFLCTLINGKKNSLGKIITPSTIVTFIHLLIHLHKVGYPGHWLSDFLQNLMSNNLVTDILPYTDALPISLRHDWKKGRPDARLQLEPWIPEMEAIVARILPALPFALTLPKALPAPEDIGLFTAMIHCYGEASVANPVASLLFFNRSKVRVENVADWQSHLLTVLRGEGAGKGMGANICIVLSMDALSWEMVGQISWRMSRARVKRMKTEGWAVAVYETQEHKIVSSTEVAKDWKELNES